MSAFEYCYCCDERTGNAGEFDGSNMVEGEPYCGDCYKAYNAGHAAGRAEGMEEAAVIAGSPVHACYVLAQAIRDAIKS